MQRLVPAIVDAWRAAERLIDDLAVGSLEGRRLAQRISVLKAAHAMASEPDAEAETVARFLEDHGLGDVVPPSLGPPTKTEAETEPA
jgi:hypothetical protein